MSDLDKLIKERLELAFIKFDKVDPENCSKTDDGDTERIMELVREYEK